jgi:hypothetical protein
VKIEDMWSDPMDESEDKEEATEAGVPLVVEPPAPRTRPPTRHSASHLSEPRQTLLLRTSTIRKNLRDLVFGPGQP